jgi:aerobic carbon-monoxide dehydrogenase medium subunit
MRYEAPTSLDAAVTLLTDAKGTAKIMAGGTDVIVLLHAEVIEPELVVDIKNIPEVTEISESGGAYRIGAAVPGMVLCDHGGFSAAWPGVIEGLSLIGSTQIQGRASLGGNLCNGSPAADSVPALIAAGATVNIIGPNGTRQALAEEIIVGPGKTSLATDEIVTSFDFQARPAHSSDCYMRLTPRTEMDIAVVGVGINLTLDDSGTCVAARVSLGAVAPTPLLVAEAANTLIGTKVDAAALDALGKAASAACNPISDKRGTKEYRIKTAAVMARRAAEKALQRAQAN